jgi:XTP/dITP diphosphohydrolase
LKLVLASANPDKAREIEALLAGAGVTVLARPDGVSDVVEDGATLEENARLKAVALVEATGEAAVADDTGLFVDALDGAPGVFTARFAGEGATYADNVAKMLAVLDGVPAARRGARFVTCALARWPDGRELSVEGVLPGRIAPAARGTNGFGYDPIFLPDPPDGDGRTLAEMSTDEKNAVSHRAKAFRALAARLVG